MAFADAPPQSDSVFHRFLSKIIDVRPSEVPALAWSWLYIFSLLSSYYILRPIRDQAGVAGGVNNLQWLFTGTLAGMLLLNIPYGWLGRLASRRRCTGPHRNPPFGWAAFSSSGRRCSTCSLSRSSGR